MEEHSEAKNYALAMLSSPQPKTRIYVESVNDRPAPVVCRHCEEPLCVSACMAGCMQKNPESGMVNNMGHEQKCVGCWMCIMACPYGVINPSFNEVKIQKDKFFEALKCDFCPGRETPACVEACPNEALDAEEM
jgi:carbon-monoxide dehydrogenase iron sulfur subunit